MIELIAPYCEDSPVRRLLAKGGGAYHLCYEVADMDRAIEESKTKGCVLVSGSVPAVAFAGRRIAWLYTPARHTGERLVTEKGALDLLGSLLERA